MDDTAHVILYTLIPTERALQPIRRGPVAAVRNRLRRTLELAVWRFLGRWRAHYSTFKDHLNTNRGDMAVRMGVKHQLIEAFQGRNVRFTEVAWGEMKDVLAFSPPPDLIVIAGGGFLFTDEVGRLPPRFIEDVAVLSELHCPVVAAAIGVNQLLVGQDGTTTRFHPAHLPDVRNFLVRLTLGSVRDRNTQAALAIDDYDTLPVIVDPGFLLAPPALFKKPAGTGTSTIAIGLNMAFHGAHTSETSHWQLPLLVRVLKRLQREFPCRFVYFVHSDAERSIAEALQIAGIPLEVVNTDVERMLEAYRRLDIHIGQMLHSAILATSVGTPALNLAYDVKATGFFALLGLPQLCLDMAATSEESLLHAVRCLIADRHEISAAILARRAELAKDSHDFYAVAAQLVPRRLPEDVIDFAAHRRHVSQ